MDPTKVDLAHELVRRYPPSPETEAGSAHVLRTGRSELHRDLSEEVLASTAKARRALDKADGELSATWTLRRNGHEVFTMPRTAAFRTFVVNHIVHHRGQLSVYLRLNDVAVPAIYGPSADEG